MPNLHSRTTNRNTYVLPPRENKKAHKEAVGYKLVDIIAHNNDQDLRYINSRDAAIDFISKDRTTIVIAHRLSTIRHSDSIIVLDGGKVIESGKHEQLIDNKSTYYRLWNVQTGVRE